MNTKKKIIIGLFVVAALAAIIGFSLNASKKDVQLVEASKVSKKADLIAIVSATGQIKPKEYVELQAEISGVITELFVKEGDAVRKGDLLLKIDPVQTRSETRAQEALVASAELDARNQESQIAVQLSNQDRERSNVRAAEVELDRAKQNLSLAKSVFERKQGLFEDNLIAREMYEGAKNDLVNAESTVATAEVRLDQARAQAKVSSVVLEQARTSHETSVQRIEQQRAMLERSLDLLAKTSIQAPLSGVITQMNVEVGERAVPGTLNNPSATLMVIADLSVIEAEVEVDETDIVDLELGQKAVVKVDALPDNPLDGMVTEIGNSAIQRASQQEAKDFKVVIQLTAPPDSLRPGLSCTGEITTATRKEVLVVPIQALTVREFPIDESGNLVREEKDEKEEEKKDEDGQEKPAPERKEFEGVFRIVDGKAQFVSVKTGIVGDAEIEVVSGLEEGDLIVTGNYKTLRSLNDQDLVKEEPKERGE